MEHRPELVHDVHNNPHLSTIVARRQKMSKAFWIIIVLYIIYLRNLQEHVKKTFCYQKFIWPFIFPTNCSTDLFFLQILGLQPRISKKKKNWSLEHFFFFFLGQKNFGNKIPFVEFCRIFWPSLIQKSSSRKQEIMTRKHWTTQSARTFCCLGLWKMNISYFP